MTEDSVVSPEKLMTFCKSMIACQQFQISLRKLSKMIREDDFETDYTCHCGELRAVEYRWSFQDRVEHCCEPPDIIKFQRELIKKSSKSSVRRDRRL